MLKRSSLFFEEFLMRNDGTGELVAKWKGEEEAKFYKHFENIYKDAPVKITRKQLGAPKHATSAYFFYAKDVYAELKEKKVQYKMTEMASKIKRDWDNLSAERRSHYEELGRKDKERFIKETFEWEKKNNIRPSRTIRKNYHVIGSTSLPYEEGDEEE